MDGGEDARVLSPAACGPRRPALPDPGAKGHRASWQRGRQEGAKGLTRPTCDSTHVNRQQSHSPPANTAAGVTSPKGCPAPSRRQGARPQHQQPRADMLALGTRHLLRGRHGTRAPSWAPWGGGRQALGQLPQERWCL